MTGSYFLSLMLLVVLCQGYPVNKAPNNLKVSVFGSDETSFRLQWNKVDSTDDAEPVVGYKVKVWQVKKVKVIKYVVSGGKVQKQEDEEIPPFQNTKSPSEEAVIIDVSADKNEAVYTGLREGVIYEVGVLAYTARGEGPLSNRIRVVLSTQD